MDQHLTDKDSLNIDNRNGNDRRQGDRRKKDMPVDTERRANYIRRTGPRRHDI